MWLPPVPPIYPTGSSHFSSISSGCTASPGELWITPAMGLAHLARSLERVRCISLNPFQPLGAALAGARCKGAKEPGPQSHTLVTHSLREGSLPRPALGAPCSQSSTLISSQVRARSDPAALESSRRWDLERAPEPMPGPMAEEGCSGSRRNARLCQVATETRSLQQPACASHLVCLLPRPCLPAGGIPAGDRLGASQGSSQPVLMAPAPTSAASDPWRGACHDQVGREHRLPG